MDISAEDRSQLVALARDAVESGVHRDTTPKTELTGILGEHLGCFVTLTNAGHLRGCIGTFSPRGPLGETILEMGRAATDDPRFVGNPITPTELSQLTIEVSVLSPLEETDEPEKLEIGRHGIYIVCGPYSGCFLPEVATDMGWGAEEFLDHCCTGKAGLKKGQWREPNAKVYLFTSEKFSS